MEEDDLFAADLNFGEAYPDGLLGELDAGSFELCFISLFHYLSRDHGWDAAAPWKHSRPSSRATTPTPGRHVFRASYFFFILCPSLLYTCFTRYSHYSSASFAGSSGERPASKCFRARRGPPGATATPGIAPTKAARRRAHRGGDREAEAGA